MKLTTKLNLVLALAFVLALAVGGALVYWLAEGDANASLLGFAAGFAVAFGLLCIALNFGVRKFVLTPIARVKGIAEQVSEGNLRGAELKAAGDDEIADMINAVNRMRRSMIRVVQLLRKHAPSTRNAA